MAGFKALRDISSQFERELRIQAANIFSAKVDECFEDTIAKKTKDYCLLTSKLRLLQAKTIAATPQVKELNKDEQSTIDNFSDTLVWKLIEQQLVKTFNQTHSVKSLITAPDRTLDPELLERKEKIIAQVTEYSQKEMTLLQLDNILKERETQLSEARKEWDNVFGRLKDSQNVPRSEERATGPLYKKLQTMVDKMELMRWVISKLVTSRTSDYDWASDPHKRLRALALTRQCHTVHSYTDA